MRVPSLSLLQDAVVEGENPMAAFDELKLFSVVAVRGVAHWSAAGVLLWPANSHDNLLERAECGGCTSLARTSHRASGGRGDDGELMTRWEGPI